MRTKSLTKAVIMARGLGTRMRKADEAASGLSNDQQQAASAGVKALIPTGSGRPFLDYVLTCLADAGFESVCLVIGPEHQQLREYYSITVRPKRLKIDFAIQPEALGTANAIAAAQTFAGEDDFLALNSDNYYPMEALLAAQAFDGMGLVGFDEDALLAGSNIPPERLRGFAAVQIDSSGCLLQIIEKPSEDVLAQLPRPLIISMNCWRFGPRIFEACRSIPVSPRGEFEITDAVRYCMTSLNCRFKVATVHAPVLDLSYQTDIYPVTQMLASRRVSI